MTLLLLGWGCETDTATPKRLIGTWETTAPKFTDRYLTITEFTISFGVKNGESTVHSITKVVRKDVNAQPVFTFHYLDREGEKWTLSVRHFTEKGDVIQLQNNQAFWNKSEAGGS